MKRELGITALAIMVVLALFGTGCKKDKEEDTSDEPTSDQQAITQLFQADSDLEEANPWSSESDDQLGGGLDDPINPIKWGRLGRFRPVSVEVQIEGDSAATITRTRSFNGVFRDVTDTTSGAPHWIDKDMHNTLVRKAHAVRIGHHRNRRLNWRISEVTPDVLLSSAPQANTLHPTRVQAFWNNGGTLEPVADVADPLNTYFNRENLPTVPSNAEVVIYLTANTINPAVAVLHPHVYRAMAHRRLFLHDDGVAPDVTAADGTYSGSYTVSARLGVFHVGLDLIDWETIYDSAGPYDAGGWAVPYRVAQ